MSKSTVFWFNWPTFPELFQVMPGPKRECLEVTAASFTYLVPYLMSLSPKNSFKTLQENRIVLN